MIDLLQLVYVLTLIKQNSNWELLFQHCVSCKNKLIQWLQTKILQSIINKAI